MGLELELDPLFAKGFGFLAPVAGSSERLAARCWVLVLLLIPR
jgi:hypothetical protein